MDILLSFLAGLIILLFFGLIVILLKLERVNAVYSFRKVIMMKYGHKVYKELPSFENMVDSFKPLKEKYWIKI